MLPWVRGAASACLASIDTPIAPFDRVSPEPILSPRAQGFDSAGTFNPAVIRRGSEIVMLFRAQDRAGTSRLGYATSKDGIHFVAWPRAVLSPEAPYEANGGVEDPRLVRINERSI